MELGKTEDEDACLLLSTRTGFGCIQSVSFFIILAFDCSPGCDSTVRSTAVGFSSAVAI